MKESIFSTSFQANKNIFSEQCLKKKKKTLGETSGGDAREVPRGDSAINFRCESSEEYFKIMMLFLQENVQMLLQKFLLGWLLECIHDFFVISREILEGIRKGITRDFFWEISGEISREVPR